MKILTTDKLSAADGIKAVTYGASGIGKTTLAVTCPAPFIFSAEKGLLSLKKHKVPYIDISTYKELIEAYKWFMASAEARFIGTLLLDSASEIAEVVLAEEKKKTADPRKAYGAMQDSMYAMIRNFRDVKGKNVVLICKQITVEDGANRKHIPIMPSQTLQAQMPYFWDLVLHCFSGVNVTTGQQYRAIHTNDNAYWTGKDRSGNLDEIEPMDLGHIFKKAIG